MANQCRPHSSRLGTLYSQTQYTTIFLQAWSLMPWTFIGDYLGRSQLVEKIHFPITWTKLQMLNLFIFIGRRQKLLSGFFSAKVVPPSYPLSGQ